MEGGPKQCLVHKLLAYYCKAAFSVPNRVCILGFVYKEGHNNYYSLSVSGIYVLLFLS